MTYGARVISEFCVRLPMASLLPRQGELRQEYVLRTYVVQTVSLGVFVSPAHICEKPVLRSLASLIGLTTMHNLQISF
jgi:hypothetical protein